MDYLAWWIVAVLVGGITVMAAYFAGSRRAIRAAAATEEALRTEHEEQNNELLKVNAELEELLVKSKSDANALGRMLEKESQYNKEIKQKYNSEHEKRIESEKELVKIQQKIIETEKRLEEFRENHEQNMKNAKLAFTETGGKVFREEAEGVYKKTMEQFDRIIKSVSGLSSRVVKHEDKVETMWKALSTPSGAGQFSEIGLENTLKNYGLEPERDFVLQPVVDDAENRSNLRPDALVFLPGGNILVIDSKASMFFLELAEVEGSEREQAILDKLKKRMNDHLRALAGRGYKDAVQKSYKKSGRDDEINHIMTAMFLHSEANIERLYQVDPEFRRKAAEYNITPTGPTGLAGFLSLARLEIEKEERNKNQEQIIHEVSKLLGYIKAALKHSENVGRGIKKAAESYEDFVRSMNSRLLPSARRINRMGVQLPGDHNLPQNLSGYHVTITDTPLIEGDAEEVKVKKLPA